MIKRRYTQRNRSVSQGVRGPSRYLPDRHTTNVRRPTSPGDTVVAKNVSPLFLTGEMGGLTISDNGAETTCTKPTRFPDILSPCQTPTRSEDDMGEESAPSKTMGYSGKIVDRLEGANINRGISEQNRNIEMAMEAPEFTAKADEAHHGERQLSHGDIPSAERIDPPHEKLEVNDSEEISVWKEATSTFLMPEEMACPRENVRNAKHESTVPAVPDMQQSRETRTPDSNSPSLSARQSPNPSAMVTSQDISRSMAESVSTSAETMPGGIRKGPEEAILPKSTKIIRVRRIDPLHRGGRYRVVQRKRGLFRPIWNKRRLNLVCERAGMSWRIVAENLPRAPRFEAYQHDKKLRPTADGHWILQDLFEPVVCKGRIYPLPRPSSRFRIFRLANERGRAVLSPSGRGTYMIVFPDDWALRQPRGLTKKLSIGIHGWSGVIVPTLDGVEILDHEGNVIETFDRPTIKTRFVGLEVPVFDGPGPLFIGEIPEVEATWEHIAQVILGREGGPSRRDKIPVKNGQWPGMPSLPHRCGWYFLRFYDHFCNLVDSLNFFCVLGLSSLTVKTLEQGDSEIVFRHSPTLTIRPKPFDSPIAIQEKGDITIATIPPGPLWDWTLWELTDQLDQSALDVSLRLNRLAWAVESHPVSDESLSWGTRLLRIPRASARPTSRWTLHISANGLSNKRIEVNAGDSWDPISLDQGGRLRIPLFRWSATVSASTQPIRLRLRVEEKIFDVLEWISSYRCLRCSEQSEDSALLSEHVRRAHEVPYRDITSYEEYKTYAPLLGKVVDLPDKVYRCHYCDELVRDDNPSMNSAMQHHQQTYHHENGVPTKVQFTVLSKVEEIETAIKATFPPIRTCLECYNPVVMLSKEAWVAHADAHYGQMIIRE